MINGDGFLLSPEEAQRIVESDARHESILFPYLVAEDLASRPDQTCSRWVINFHDWSLDTAEGFLECMRIVRERVLPHRAQVRRKSYRERWWQFAERQETMLAATAGLQRVLVGPQTAKWWAVTFVPNGWVYSHATTVFCFEDGASAAVLSSVFHEAWMQRHSGSLRQFPRYSASDCFENFAFPERVSDLDEVGDRFLSFRKETLLAEDQGLTKVYNRVHEHPEDTSGRIEELRRLRRNLDRAVADAYGWSDLDLDHGFRETPFGLRYTISGAVKTEALDRLLEINHSRYAEEVAKGLHAKGTKKGRHPQGPLVGRAAGVMTKRRSFVFVFGEGLAADDPVARWVTSLSMSWNDIVFAHVLYSEHNDGGPGIYLVRVAAGHLSEAFDPSGPFGLGYDEWSEVQEFVATLPKRARDDFERLRSAQADRSIKGTLSWRLGQMRNHVFHYPHLHAARSGGERLDLTRTLRGKAADEGSVSVQDETVKGIRLGFADDVSIALAFARAKIDPSDVRAVRTFTKELLGVQQRFIRFGEVAIDRYLQSLPGGVLRSAGDA